MTELQPNPAGVNVAKTYDDANGTLKLEYLPKYPRHSRCPISNKWFQYIRYDDANDAN